MAYFCCKGSLLRILLLPLALVFASSVMAESAEERIRSVLSEQVPRLQVREIRETDMENIYEVRTAQETLYMTGDASHAFLRTMLRFDDEDGIVNVTEQGRSVGTPGSPGLCLRRGHDHLFARIGGQGNTPCVHGHQLRLLPQAAPEHGGHERHGDPGELPGLSAAAAPARRGIARPSMPGVPMIRKKASHRQNRANRFRIATVIIR